MNISIGEARDKLGNESYTAFVYEEDSSVVADESMYDKKEDAVSFAKFRGWDEVVNDLTGEVVWENKSRIISPDCT